MDVWERTVRKLLVERSKNAVDYLNPPSNLTPRGRQNFYKANRKIADRIKTQLRLIVILYKLNSPYKSKAARWASLRLGV